MMEMKKDATETASRQKDQSQRLLLHLQALTTLPHVCREKKKMKNNVNTLMSNALHQIQTIKVQNLTPNV